VLKRWPDLRAFPAAGGHCGGPGAAAPGRRRVRGHPGSQRSREDRCDNSSAPCWDVCFTIVGAGTSTGCFFRAHTRVMVSPFSLPLCTRSIMPLAEL